MKKLLATTAVILALSANAASAKECSNITKDEVISAQKAWGDGIVAIGKAEDHKKAALNHLDTLYAYDLGTVLFKPTKAAADQFRGTEDDDVATVFRTE
ncbi:MAG: hypothetical protein O3A58_03705, partial [Proteobacteria bacterium]|nr:hypothetical protein [Pseudomonadota bacterium]